MKTFLLCDIDGTLLYSNKVDSRCFADSYEHIFGREFPTIDWTQFPQVTDHVIFRTAFHRHFGRYPAPAERDGFERHYLAALQELRLTQPEEFREVPGATDFWRRMSQRSDTVMGIATGGWRAPAQIKLSHVGIAPTPYAAYADGMESRDDILNSAIALARNDHDISRIVYFGDAIWDAETTQRMGLPMIGVRREGDFEVLHRAGVDRVISDYEGAEGVLREASFLT